MRNPMGSRTEEPAPSTGRVEPVRPPDQFPIPISTSVETEPAAFSAVTV